MTKLLFATVSISASLAAATARADVSAAARAFSDGQAAQLEGNFERAAQSFELAFNIAPSREALRSAVRARQQAGQLPRAATLAYLLQTEYPDDAASTKLAAEVLAEASPKLARVSVTCTPACSLAVDGRAISLTASSTHVVFTNPGKPTFEASFDNDRATTRDLPLQAGDELDLTLTAPAPAPAAAAPRPTPRPPQPAAPAPSHGLSPAFAITGGVITLGLAGATIWSGLDTNSAHDAYVKMPTHDAFTSGQSKQTRTNILLGTTIAAGVATTAVAVFWTRWVERAASDIAINPTPGGATVSFSGHF